MDLWTWNKPPEIAYTFGHLLMITLYVTASEEQRAFLENGVIESRAPLQ